MEYVSKNDTRVAGKIRAIAAPRVLVTVGDGRVYRKLLLLTFARDGSIFVQWPYFRQRSGILADARFRDGRLGGTYDLEKIGRSTSHLVKFSHHIDGNAHFSQDGRVKTAIRRKSFRLDGPLGHLFQPRLFTMTA